MTSLSLKEKSLQRLKELSSSPKRSLGQNFLIEPSVVSQIIKAVKSLDKEWQWFEIGPGLGALTDQLIDQGLPLKLLEMDKNFAEYWRQRQLSVFEGDALKTDWEQLTQGSPSGLVSNLPYQISSSLVIELSIASHSFEAMVLMFQKEVAQRITSASKQKSYGLLSVLAQSYWQVNKVCEVAPRCFYPAPRVASRVLQFQKIEGPQSPDLYLRLVKSCFSQRRKLVLKSLKRFLQEIDCELDAVQLLKEFGAVESLRAEDLSVEDFKKLHERVLNGR